MDLLRIFSAFFVVTIHLSNLYANQICSSGTAENVLFDILCKILSIADPIFFMISGSMLLNTKKNYSFNDIIKLKIPKLLIAFAFWSFIYSFIENIIISFLHGGNSKNLFINFVKDFFLGYNHMWFILALVFIYLAVPFLKKICEDKISELIFIILASVVYFFAFIDSIHSFAAINDFIEETHCLNVGYVLFFVLGHYLFKYDIPIKIRIVFYIISTVILIFSVIYKLNYDYLSFPNELLSVSVFLICKYGLSKIKFKEKNTKKIVKLSSLTFGTYLTHQLFVIAFSAVISIFAVKRFFTVFSIFVSVFVFVLSLLFTYILSKIPILKKYII